MSNILLAEPAYRSKFPPLGLMRLSTYHKEKGDQVTFVRGFDDSLRSIQWHRIYISSLFTWELPRTLKTVKYYVNSVSSEKNIFVGGPGVTLLPNVIKNEIDCSVIEGQIDAPNIIGPGSPPIAKLYPDYSLLDSVDYSYTPKDAYFVRVSKGCPRSCSFCAVPLLEKEFGLLKGVQPQISEVNEKFGEKQNLIILDNNILALNNIEAVVNDIQQLGFHSGAKRNNKKRAVDFNQGIDARLISKNPKIAKFLASICLSPVRLAFDQKSMEKSYRTAVLLLREHGFNVFTNYMLFNFQDNPEDLYYRIMTNASLNEELDIRISGFPMRFVPMDDINRRYVAKKWKWRYLRGIQCVLIVTRGLISPNPVFVRRAFGKDFREFLEILSMPDRYIIYREKHENNGVESWRSDFRKLSSSERNEFLDVLEVLNKSRKKKEYIERQPGKYRNLLEHYYPGGQIPE